MYRQALKSHASLLSVKHKSKRRRTGSCVCVASIVSRYLLNFHEIRLEPQNTPTTIRVTSMWIVHLFHYASSEPFVLHLIRVLDFPRTSSSQTVFRKTSGYLLQISNGDKKIYIAYLNTIGVHFVLKLDNLSLEIIARFSEMPLSGYSFILM